MAWTTPTSRSTGNLITASIWNTDLVANLAYLKNAPTFDGIITVNGFGVHSFTTGGTGTNRLLIENTTSGAANSASLRITAGTSGFFIHTFSQGYTPSGSEFASGTEILVTTSGGLAIRASAGTVKIYGTATLAATFAAAGVTIPGTLDVTGITTFTAAPVFSSGTASQTVELTAGKALTTVAFTGTGNYVKSASPTMTGTIGAASMTLSGTLGLTGDFAINTDKFTVQAVSGATVVAGTLDVAGSVTVSGGSSVALTLSSVAGGVGTVTGRRVSIGRNSSGSGAAGVLNLVSAGGTNYYLWVDATGDLRIGTAAPEEDGTPSDTSGTVVGTQT
jgi:hypothetical protein